MILSTEWPLCHVRELRYGLSKFFEGKSKILENAFLIFTIFTHPNAFIPLRIGHVPRNKFVWKIFFILLKGKFRGFAPICALSPYNKNYTFWLRKQPYKS